MKNEISLSEYKYIVGIGASAGGLEALQKFLSALPANTGFPYIIIQHLSPDYKSLLGEILGKYTEMPVIQVEDGMEVKPNCVYVIQPGKNMRISKGRLLLSAQKEKELNLPIDMFFRSLAEEAGSKAIAVILSGTGSDGTNGIKDIKENDGMIIVQDIDSSKFDGMPRSAMRTGLVDVQISPEEIALELEHIANSTKDNVQPVKTEREIDDELMKKIYFVLKKVSNVNFTHYKQTTILRRIERRMMLTHKETLSDYVDFLYESPEEVRTLSREVLIGVTSFFRDPDFFQCLKDRAIQDILIHSTTDEPVRVWVAGCSTGEEAYSIAILFSEAMETLKLRRTVKIFATDLDVEAITAAGKGVYGDSIIDAVSTPRLSRYFTRRNNTYTINRDIRKMIVFSPHNVFQDPPFGRLDLISCRNMLIYFQPVLQNDLFAIFHTSIKDGGFLFLGKSEAIGAYTEAFPVVDAAAKIFTHRSDVKIPGAKTVPYLQTTYLDDEYANDSYIGFPRPPAKGEMGFNEQASINNTLLEQFMPTCLVINENNELIHSYGDSANFVHLPLGRFTNGLFDLITEALKIPVSTLLKESREKKKKAQYKNIHFTGERSQAVIDMTVMPINRNVGESEEIYAIVLSEAARRGDDDDDSVTFDIDRVASQRITDLEQELGEVQAKLNRSVAEQECVNEELQAANEELLTANEELQSSNEELQSVNEELYTVNSEYQQKLTELNDLNDDIANFLTSTLTGIIFVDNKLNIRRYTDYVTTEFSVMDHDIGRSLQFISYHFPTVDITEICVNVLKTLVPDEREITTNKNKVFFMRVAPYRSTENKILGCVITLMDVTSQKQDQAIIQSTEKRLSMAMQASDAKSDYLSRIAYEIRNPMSSLIHLSRIARSAADKAALEPVLDKMNDTIDYMSSIVTDISEASISERLAGEQVAEPFSLRRMLDDLTEMLIQRVEEAKLHFNVIIDDRFDPEYVGNKAKLQQILLNFLGNSVKYTKPDGHVTLRVYEEPRQSELARLCFIVADTGIGIKKEFIPRLFKPFDHSEKNDDSEPMTTGLGLSIAYNLIMSMSGDVSVESEVGKGSTFTIHVQLERYNPNDDAVGEAVIEPPTDYGLAGKHILIAEDNALNRRILGAMLTTEGMTFAEASDGEAAVNKFVESPAGTFDCILMDMRMPKLDGIKATMMIRESEKEDAATIPIIGVSANGFADDIRQARLAGINEYTTKPIERESLMSAMNKLIVK